MINIKKIGLTALAGSLVAVSAYAGELSVSGGAKMTYTADTGNEDVQDDGNRFGLQRSISFGGSGELDNGHTVSLSHTVVAGGGLTSSVLTYDMGDLGKLSYNQDSATLGIAVIDDLTPSADEEVFNGLDTEGASNEAPVGYASQPSTGFNYTYSAMDGVQVDVGYASKSTGTSNDDGVNGVSAGLRSSSSIAVQYTGIEGAKLFAGTGELGAATSTSDVDTYGFTYAFGPITVGAQRTDIDYTAANSDLETDAFGISFAVNDNLSISYGQSETSVEGSTVEQELSGISIGYSMGGMTLKAHKNKGEKIANTANNESEHTEIALSFAF